MNLRTIQFVSLAITLTLFGAVDLIVTLVTPGEHHGWLVVPPLVAGVGVLLGFPYGIALYQSQQDEIEKRVLELKTQHAMDTAIVAEMELDRVLEVAVTEIMGAVDAVAGGVILYDPVTGVERTIVLRTPDHDGADTEAFARLVRSSDTRPHGLWREIRYPLGNGSEGAGEASVPLGRLVAARARPCRPFSDTDHALAQALAGTVTVAVHNADALAAAHHAAQVVRESEQVRAALNRERRIAQALTEGLLPEIAPRIGGFHISKRYEAQSDEADVGGDIYDLFPLEHNRWGVVIADVSGKGLAAAQQTAMVKYSLRSYAREHSSPAMVLSRLNDTLSDEDQMSSFVTLFYGILDPENCRLTYGSAGHEPPILHRDDGTFETLQPTGMVLGAMRDMPYEDAVIDLRPGDGLLLYTDGLTEARSAQTGDFLSIEGVEAMLTELADVPPDALAGALWERVVEYTGNRQLDDTALLWIHHFGAK